MLVVPKERVQQAQSRFEPPGTQLKSLARRSPRPRKDVFRSSVLNVISPKKVSYVWWVATVSSLLSASDGRMPSSTITVCQKLQKLPASSQSRTRNFERTAESCLLQLETEQRPHEIGLLRPEVFRYSLVCLCFVDNASWCSCHFGIMTRKCDLFVNRFRLEPGVGASARVHFAICASLILGRVLLNFGSRFLKLAGHHCVVLQ